MTSSVLKHVQVHVPFPLLKEKLLPMVVREGVPPEIGLSHVALDGYSRADFAAVAERLAGEGLPVTLHAPFVDLRPGALDPEIRRVTAARLQQVFDLAPLFRPRSIVCHPSFDIRYYVTAERLWLEHSVETWRAFLPQAERMGTIIALENVYERDPHELERLLAALPPERVCCCFDTGHFNAFATTPLDRWIDALGDRIGQLHIHDNHGRTDEHLPVGEGTFPFAEFFRRLRELGRRPIITIEAHSEKNLWRAVKNLEDMNLLAILETDPC
ncbi:MAG TPA: sugar phosphate isomerase/epimerase family protein [Syntrophales bacterium]|nr:sugar phosphate isomerase/epimerase family protein [Syntrophales bacterium]